MQDPGDHQWKRRDRRVDHGKGHGQHEEGEVGQHGPGKDDVQALDTTQPTELLKNVAVDVGHDGEAGVGAEQDQVR